MIKTNFNDKKFMKDMTNLVKYTDGFFEGAQRGKAALYSMLAPRIAELASQYIDANARVNPDLLHHVYEWNKSGNPSARLFDINYSISNVAMSFMSEFKQSTTIQKGSNTAFFNKAEIMEKGMTVIVRPKRANALRFEIDGDEVFTSNPVVIDNPGGVTQGQFEKVMREFFNVYLRQSFMTASGVAKHLSRPTEYKKNIKAGTKSGRTAGIKAGYKWVVGAGAKF